jgi:hypothetical protein
MSRTLPAVLTVVVSMLAVIHAAQGPAPAPRDPTRTAQPDAARIRGRILAADTAQPVGRAQVTLSGPSFQPRRTLTDAEGRYEFAELPAGTFSVSATKTGYVNLQYGQRRPFEPGIPVEIAAGQTVDRIDVTLPRGAVIVVRVSDDLGSPIAGVEVRAQRFQYGSDGQRTLAAIYGPGPSQTDDRGELRLFGLMPGEYVVSAVARFQSPSSTGAAATSEGYAPTFYPGVISPGQATPISVRIGEETSAQFSMVRSRLARVSGIVVDSQGRPANGARLWLATAMPAINSGANVGPDGRFVIADVAPGEYAVQVNFDAIEEVATTLTVDGFDVSDLRIVVGPGTAVSGRVVFEGRPMPAGAASSFRVVLADVTRSVGLGLIQGRRAAVVDAEGRFGFTGVSGRVMVDVTSPEGWMMKSVVVDRLDVTDTSLDLGRRPTLSDVIITLTNRLTTVSAAVTDTRGQPLRSGAVVIVPVETYEGGIMARRVRVVRPDPDGTFATRGMMPGRYLAVAVDALEEGRQFSPEFQQQVRRLGRELSLKEGESATLNLRLTPDL